MGMVIEVNESAEGVEVVIEGRRVFVDAESDEVRIWMYGDQYTKPLAIIDLHTGESKL